MKLDFNGNVLEIIRFCRKNFQTKHGNKMKETEGTQIYELQQKGKSAKSSKNGITVRKREKTFLFLFSLEIGVTGTF